MRNDKDIKVNKYSEIMQIATAIFALSIGLLVYLFDRQPDNIYFISGSFSQAGNFPRIFGQIGDHLPTFIHVYVFILLTASVTSVSAFQACILWFAIDGLLEFAQFTPIAHWIAGNVPAWFSGVPFLENTASYFLKGTFDVLDLVSIILGTIAAYLTIKYGRRGERL